MSHPAIVIGVGIAAALLILAVHLLRTIGPATLPYYSKETLLSRGELAFYRYLRHAVPKGVSVSFKVRLSDLIGCSAQGCAKDLARKISQKHVDFVLVDAETSAILLAIELDDKTHLAADRRERDRFVDKALAAAGIAILRVSAAAEYDLRVIRNAVNERLREAA